MMNLLSWSTFLLRLKHFLIIFSIIIAIDFVLNLLVFVIYLFCSLFKIKYRKDSNTFKTILTKGDKTKLRTLGFNIGHQIGSGYYATVYKAYHKVSSNRKEKIEQIAIKVIDVNRTHQILKKINAIDVQTMRTTLNNAINNLEKINNENIVKIEKFDKISKSNQIMKLFLFSKMAEISLNDYLINQCSSGVGEECARVWFRQICEAVQYLHNVHKVSHRNIKPENILLFPNSKVNNNSNKIPLNAKLSDCGIADLFPNCSKVCTQTDPIFVISPLETSSNELMVYDIYTVGVVLMLMLKGDTKSLVENNKPFALFCQMTDKYVNEISDRQLSDLLEKMVNSSVGSRIDMSAILSHPWVKRSSKAYNELKTKSISNYS